MPIGSNCVGTLLTSKLSLAARLEHEEALLKNSHRPDHIARAEGNRREAIAFEVALVPVITSEDYATFKEIDTQANMDIESLLVPTWDGKTYVK